MFERINEKMDIVRVQVPYTGCNYQLKECRIYFEVGKCATQIYCICLLLSAFCIGMKQEKNTLTQDNGDNYLENRSLYTYSM